VKIILSCCDSVDGQRSEGNSVQKFLFANAEKHVLI